MKEECLHVWQQGVQIGKEGSMIQVDAFAWTICYSDTMMVQKWDIDIYRMKSHETEQQ
jgi:hypothetical protein